MGTHQWRRMRPKLCDDMTVAATISLNADSGSFNSDGITNDATVNVTLATDAASWEYSVDGGSNWSTGSNTSFELADDTTFAINDIQVRQTDTAGNTSAAAKNAAQTVTDMAATLCANICAECGYWQFQ